MRCSERLRRRCRFMLSQSGTTVAIPPLHAHHFIAAVHVDDLPGDRRCSGAGEENAGVAKFIRVTTALQRRMFFIVLEHEAEAGDAPCSQRLHGPGADAVNADFLRSKVVGEISCEASSEALATPITL